jgi:hypothetical protein
MKCGINYQLINSWGVKVGGSSSKAPKKRSVPQSHENSRNQ